MATDDITAIFEEIRIQMEREGPKTAGQEGLVTAFYLLCIDMRRTADLLQQAHATPGPTQPEAKEKTKW